jgi:hypothetical protein
MNKNYVLLAQVASQPLILAIAIVNASPIAVPH